MKLIDRSSIVLLNCSRCLQGWGGGRFNCADTLERQTGIQERQGGQENPSMRRCRRCAATVRRPAVSTCARPSPPIRSASRASRCASTTCCSTGRNARSTAKPCGCSTSSADAGRRRSAPRGDVRGREDQHHRGPGGAAYRAAQPRRTAPVMRRRRGRDARRARRARRDGRLRRRACASGSAHGRDRQAASPTSSISASAAPISGPRWRRWRWRPIMTGRARISSPMSTAPISHDTLEGSTRPRRCSSSPRRPSPPSRR